MTDITVRIMVEVLSILGIVTKEIGQGKISTSFPVNISKIIDLPVEKKYLRELVRRKDVMGAFQRLDKLTQEAARVAAAEVLKMTHSIDDKVKDVDEKVESVDERAQSVGMKAEGIEDKIQGVDHKVGSVTQGEIYLH